jgi:hypothetical protein
MGKAILILALGMSLLVTMLIFSLNKNTNTGLATAVNSYSNTKARLIANSGIEIYLEKLREDKSLTGNFLNNSLMNGTYDMYITGSDTIYVKSVGHYNGVTHISYVKASRDSITFPNINSAVYVSSNNTSLNLNGNMTISGYDHDINGNLIDTLGVKGMGVDNTTDSAFVADSLSKKVSGGVTGTGGSPSVGVVPDTTNWLALTEAYIFAADTTLPTGTYTTGTVLGTQSSPKITYAAGDVNLSGTAYGYGILIVNGNLTMSGQFTYHGIVIAYGQSTINTKTTGDAGIFGAAIFVGESVNMQSTGNAQLLYSKAAIDNAKVNLKSSRFNIFSWWE